MSFGEKLKELREQAGMTQQSLAQAANISISAVRAYEQSPQIPSLENAFKLADGLKVDVSVFKACVVEQGEKPEPKPKKPAKKGK